MNLQQMEKLTCFSGRGMIFVIKCMFRVQKQRFVYIMKRGNLMKFVDIHCHILPGIDDGAFAS